MIKTLMPVGLAALVVAAAAAAFAKLPPPPPMTDAQKQAAEEKKEKDKAAAEKAKADLTAAEDAAVKNYQGNMKQEGKPIPKPVATADASQPPSGGKPKPQANTSKAGAQATPNAASGGTQK